MLAVFVQRDLGKSTELRQCRGEKGLSGRLLKTIVPIGGTSGLGWLEKTLI